MFQNFINDNWLIFFLSLQALKDMLYEAKEEAPSPECK